MILVLSADLITGAVLLFGGFHRGCQWVTPVDWTHRDTSGQQSVRKSNSVFVAWCERDLFFFLFFSPMSIILAL